MSVRVIFMGTPDFAVPTLDALVAQGWDVLVVTQPDKKVGRKQILTPPPVKKAALAHGLFVLQPERLRDPDVLAKLTAFAPDLLVTAAYGQLLPKSLLALPRVGPVNVHASLLPRWRGAAPIHRALASGDERTGVTLMEMVPALDAGPIIAARSIPIEPTDDVGSLHDKLAALGAQMCREFLPQYLAGALTPTPQPETGVTYAAKIERADEFIVWQQTVAEISRHVRALSPWPGAATVFNSQTLKIWSLAKTSANLHLSPGRVVLHKGQVLVGCADGVVALATVQPAGRRKMAASDWYSGVRDTEIQFQDGVPR